jgi:hypothetical protein
MVSTPNAPDGLFEHIEKEDEETCLYNPRGNRQGQSLAII